MQLQDLRCMDILTSSSRWLVRTSYDFRHPLFLPSELVSDDTDVLEYGYATRTEVDAQSDDAVVLQNLHLGFAHLSCM